MASGPITSWQIDGETVSDFIFGGSKITAYGDCSHEIKRLLLLGRKVMTNLDSIFKSRDIALPTNLTDMTSDVPFHHNICSWKPFPLVQNRGKVEFLICLTIAVVYQVLYSWMVFSSVQFSRSVVSNSLRPHESRHGRPPCPSPTPGGHSDSRPSSLWCCLCDGEEVAPD